MTAVPAARYLSRSVVLAYLLALIGVPVGLILWCTLAPGLGAFIGSITTPAAISALNVSLLLVAIVVPLNVVFGVPTALFPQLYCWLADGFGVEVSFRRSSTSRSPYPRW